jgi:hypothetical protein
VEVPVERELLPGPEPEGRGRDRGPQALEVALAAPPRRQPGRRNLEQLARLEQLLERDVVRAREQVDPRVERLRQVVDARERDVAAAAGALGRPDQVLGREQTQRLADGRAADAEVGGEDGLVRQPRPARQLAFDDLLAQPAGDELIRLAYAATSAAMASRYRATEPEVVTSA